MSYVHLTDFNSKFKMADKTATFPCLDFSGLLICYLRYFLESKKLYFISITISLMFDLFWSENDWPIGKEDLKEEDL